MKREHLFAGFFFAAFLFLLYQFYRVFHVFAGSFTWAALLALIFFPIRNWLVRLLRQREGLAAFLLTTVVILTVMVPTIYITVLLASESAALFDRVRTMVEQGDLARIVERLESSRLGGLWQKAAPHFARWNIDVPAVALRATQTTSAFLVAQAPTVAANALRALVSFFMTAIALFFFFRDGERMVNGLRNLIPMEAAHKDAILARLYETLSAVVQGTLVTAAVQGFLAGIGFVALGVPFAVLLGCATAILSLLPMGAPIAWGGTVVYLLLAGAYVRAVILLVWGTLIVSGADNVIRPWIIGGKTRIPTVFLFFGILGGLQAYGFLGVFLGPTLIAILVAFSRIYREQYAIPQTEDGGPS